MKESQQKILDLLDGITAPLSAHIEKLEAACKEGNRPVTQNFLLMYQAELLKYNELGLAILEEFLSKQEKPETPSVGELEVNTPKGNIIAKIIPDKEYPGIGVFSNAPGEPGAIVEYDPLKDYIQIRIYGKDDPDGDPISIMKLSD